MAESLDLLKDHMDLVESLLHKNVTDHVLETHINAMCQQVINAGGKRMRPRLSLLCALALAEYNQAQYKDQICHIAAALEVLHTATLVHDDVIDRAPLRRGAPTLNESDGNHVAVLAGDYLFTRCFSLIEFTQNFDIIREMNRTLAQLVTGEIYQLENEGNVTISDELYYKTIYCKTGVLFELSACAIALLDPDCKQYVEPLKTIGRNLGIAFQIKDDMLDFTSNSETLGKDAGADLDDQRVTLPILKALQTSSNQQALIDAIHNKDFVFVKQAILDTNALEQCQTEALKTIAEAKKCMEIFQEGPFKQQLFELCDKILSRQS